MWDRMARENEAFKKILGTWSEKEKARQFEGIVSDRKLQARKNLKFLFHDLGQNQGWNQGKLGERFRRYEEGGRPCGWRNIKTHPTLNGTLSEAYRGVHS